MKTLNEWNELLDDKLCEYDEILQEIDNLKSKIFELEDRESDLSDEIDDIKIHIKSGEYGDFGYYLLKLQYKCEKNLQGYTEIEGKYIICNGYILLSLNEKPPLLKKNENHRVNSDKYHEFMNFKAENTYKAGSIDEYMAIDEKSIKIGKARINIDFAKAVWEILRVNENSVVKDYIYRCRGDKAYSIYVGSERGCAIIIGMTHNGS